MAKEHGILLPSLSNMAAALFLKNRVAAIICSTKFDITIS